jgi:hypothetical protein
MDIRKLGGLIQSIKIGMNREELENLLGKLTNYALFGNSLYDIDDLRQVSDPVHKRQTLVPVYLLVKFEGDEERKQAFKNSGENFEELKKGLHIDKLLEFALEAFSE